MLLPMQQGDSTDLKSYGRAACDNQAFRSALHEFLPNAEELMVEITRLRLTEGSKAEIEKKEELCATACLKSTPCWGTGVAAWVSLF